MHTAPGGLSLSLTGGHWMVWEFSHVLQKSASTLKTWFAKVPRRQESIWIRERNRLSTWAEIGKTHLHPFSIRRRKLWSAKLTLVFSIPAVLAGGQCMADFCLTFDQDARVADSTNFKFPSLYVEDMNDDSVASTARVSFQVRGLWPCVNSWLLISGNVSDAVLSSPFSKLIWFPALNTSSKVDVKNKNTYFFVEYLHLNGLYLGMLSLPKIL